MAIKDLLRGKTAKEKADIKGAEIANIIKAKKHEVGKRYKLDKKTGLWS